MKSRCWPRVSHVVVMCSSTRLTPLRSETRWLRRRRREVRAQVFLSPTLRYQPASLHWLVPTQSRQAEEVQPQKVDTGLNFLFHQGSAVWLDRERRCTRTVRPGSVRVRFLYESRRQLFDSIVLSSCPVVVGRIMTEAFVTLVTNDDYARGALVLGQSLRDVQTSKRLVVMLTDAVSARTR